jgi:hypothetical protein
MCSCEEIHYKYVRYVVREKNLKKFKDIFIFVAPIKIVGI